MSATITNDELTVRFEAPWTLEKHALFIRTKRIPEAQIDYTWQDDSYTLKAPARFAPLIGLDVPQSCTAAGMDIADYLFDFQRWIVQKALEAKRYAVWADCGLGKTPMQLEWARHVIARTCGRVLILAPLAVCHQTRDEAEKFYGRAPVFLETREALSHWCKGIPPAVGVKADEKRVRAGEDCSSWWPNLALCNYEKLIAGVLTELRWLAGIALDESSILKSGGGVIKWNMIKSARGIEYKSSWTATPAPNDTMEYASQAGFLEKLRAEGEILWTFFHRDMKTQKWHVKPHAEEAFYRFMSAWSIYLRKPSAYGFRDPFADVPEPDIIEVKIPATDEQNRLAMQYHRSYDPGSLLPKQRLGMTQRSKLSQLAKGFIYQAKSAKCQVPSAKCQVPSAKCQRVASNKPALVADLVRQGLWQGKQVLVWTVFDEESVILREAMGRMTMTGMSELVNCATNLIELSDAFKKIEVLTGSDSEERRVGILDSFRRGKVRCLISKAQLLGYGLNFQFCTWMIFSGFDDSFERFYQAVRRCYRYGSREQLKVFVPYVPGLEDHVWENVLRKKSRWEADTARQEENYRKALNND